MIISKNFKDKSKFVLKLKEELNTKEVSKIIYHLQGGSSMDIIKLNELNKKAKFVKITKAGFYESMVHSVEMTEKSLNYKL